MVRSRHILPVSLSILLVAAAGAVAVTMSARTAGDATHEALSHLSAGRFAEAERAATHLATRDSAPVNRAWLIVASARQRQGKHAEAVEAYQRFLRSCDSLKERQYVLRQIRTCRAAARPAPAPTVPSKQLTEEQKTQLARVEDEFFTESSDNFLVRAKNKLLPKILARQAQIDLARICKVIMGGQEYPHSVSITVWPNREQYLANAEDAPEWSGGNFRFSVVDGIVTRHIDLTQLDAEGRFDTVMLDRVLPHEMSHLVLKEHFGDAACPVFLNEGLAMLAESLPDPQRVILAGAALAGDSAIPLSDLLARDRRNDGKQGLFYAESYSLVSFLHGKMTPNQFRSFLTNVKAGCTVTDAIQRALCTPLDKDFPAKLAIAWQRHAITDAQYTRALGARAAK